MPFIHIFSTPKLLEYKINKRKLDNYVNKNKLRIEGAFRKRIIEDDVIENQDLFNFLTDAFSIDGVDRAIILEREHDNKEFLKSAHARKKLDELVHDYLINRREMSNINSCLYINPFVR